MSHLVETENRQAQVDEEFNMFVKGIDELMRATFAARKTELDNVVGNERTAADVCLTGLLEIKNIDKQIKNRSVKGEICVQTKRLTPRPHEQEQRQTIRIRGRNTRSGSAEHCNSRKSPRNSRQMRCATTRKGLALLQALFSNEQVKTSKWQDLLTKKIDAKTALLKRHDEAISQTRIKK